MAIVVEKSICQDFGEAIQREWLETNGLGGWASSTVAGAHSRRYHGLLVVATNPPVGRMVLLSRLDETVCFNGNRFELGCNEYPNAVFPTGFRFLQSFTQDLFPAFAYELEGISLRKTIAAVNGENTSLVLYEVLRAPGPFSLELAPLVAARDFHSLTHANAHICREASFEQGIFRVRPYDGAPELFLQVPGATFEARPDWYYNFTYRMELARGLDFQEDLFCYGVFRTTLQQGSKLGVVISDKDTSGRDAFDLFAHEKTRREGLLNRITREDDVLRQLTLAADQFVVNRAKDDRTIIAGYHWFSDWGRDTMIALPGICLVTGRFDEARKILHAFAESVSRGMLPNRFPDSGEEPEYNTVDATFWFFVAIYKYFQYTNDLAFIRDELMPILRDIIAWHDRGTRYGIHVDEDGLLYAGEPGVQLTWMDAKIGDWVVTPRQGKAVEINALWYNALSIYAELAGRLGAAEEAEVFTKRGEQVKDRFLEVFWYEEGEYLYDYVDGGERNTAIRPNQIFAISLPFPLLTGRKAQSVLGIVEGKLYTPLGLRSLAPDDPLYRPHYEGDALSRDSAYHQGTIWGWLLGPFVTAIVRVEGSVGKKRALEMVRKIVPHMGDAGIGTISEIFDAEPPHAPRGCIAQAWSVAEILRAYVEDVVGSTSL